LKTVAKSNFFESVQGKAFMQTVKKKIVSSKRKFREKVCSHRLLGPELSPDHGYATYKWLYDAIRVYDNKSPVLMGGKMELSTHLKVISPQYIMNANKVLRCSTSRF
jgi:hypothetical protein